MTSIVNFRDIGGQTTFNGRKVKKGLLFRSAELIDLEPEDIEFLHNKNISQVIDFRSKNEVTNTPNHIIHGIVQSNLDILADTFKDAPHKEDWLAELEIEKARTHMLGVYKDFVLTESSKNGYKEFLNLVLQTSKNQKATLFHCAAGKDRTGFAAALILKILGVSHEDIFDDYMKTAEGRKEANEQIISNYSKKGLSDHKLNAIRIMFSVEKEFLEESFAEIERKYGGFHEFLQQALGITQKEIEELREVFLE